MDMKFLKNRNFNVRNKSNGELSPEPFKKFHRPQKKPY